jgi:exonuclease SbcD
VAIPVKTPASETVCIDFDGPPDMAKLAEMAADAAHKFVRVRWTVNEEHRQLVDREAIEALCRECRGQAGSACPAGCSQPR